MKSVENPPSQNALVKIVVSEDMLYYRRETSVGGGLVWLSVYVTAIVTGLQITLQPSAGLIRKTPADLNKLARWQVHILLFKKNSQQLSS